MTSDVNVGRMYSSPLLMNELFDDAVVISNSPFLPDARYREDGERGGKGGITHP
jgi:hypothetical protein